MGNCVKCHLVRDYSEASYPTENMHSELFLSEGSLVSCDSNCSQSTLNEPSMFSFKSGIKTNNVYYENDACIICLERYDDKVHNPLILPCGHMFCAVCIRMMAKKRRFKSIRCPVDREKHHITKDVSRADSSLRTFDTEAQTIHMSDILSLSNIDQSFNDQQIQLNQHTIEYLDSWYAHGVQQSLELSSWEPNEHHSLQSYWER